MADIDGDGRPDLVVTDADGHAVFLLRQDPTEEGRFLSPEQIAGDVRPYQAAVADLDGDGAPDIAIAGAASPQRLIVLFQDPAARGRFRPPIDFPLPGSSDSIAVGDVDGDGRLDLVVWSYVAGYPNLNGELATFLQRPDGTLVMGPTLTSQRGVWPERLHFADYDGDGLDDLVVFFSRCCDGYTNRISVLLHGPQSGTFAAPVDTSLDGVQGINDATVADLNGDGRPDVAVVGFFPVGSPSVVQSHLNVFMQAGGGAFALTRVYELPMAASCVAAGDIDGDGLNDLVVLGGDDEVMLLRQSSISHGTFEAPRTLP